MSSQGGPTPVSALIHAATMVIAGVFMIARCSPLFEYPPTALIVITFAGAMTSFLAATTGILQNDLMKFKPRRRGIENRKADSFFQVLHSFPSARLSFWVPEPVRTL
ncbi:unnamed protein product [Lactuca virosa]|uniref:NADH:quinone oxidoreductase/Mrp antiporter transmembrane domain-containing protein n=1 Tax=Lactuca virosa TaxID=75947 RepID=A0AAU9NKD8_9ASTR|nr:unnamed protein product [Lactuca virosa]